MNVLYRHQCPRENDHDVWSREVSIGDGQIGEAASAKPQGKEVAKRLFLNHGRSFLSFQALMNLPKLHCSASNQAMYILSPFYRHHEQSKSF
jgi:hypothetical protein